VLGADGNAVTLARRGALIEQPVHSVLEWTPATLRSTVRDADTGALARVADLVDALRSDDRVQGVLSTRSHGLLGLPLTFYGGRRQVKALEGQRSQRGDSGIPGDWWKMFPESELAQLVEWGILLGVGLAERVHQPRSIAERDTPKIKVWNPRWLRWDWSTQTWRLQTSDGEIEITPGDGQWILYTPYGSNRPWMYGAWRSIAFPWVLKQFALHDRARHSEVQGSAVRVGSAPEGATEASRKGFLRSLRSMGRDNAFVMPAGYDYKVVEANSRTWEIYGAQIEWADRAIAITLTGQFVTTEGTKGFSNGNIHAAVKEDLIQFTAESLTTTLHEQGLRPWANDNFGSPELAPHAHYDTEPPEDRKTQAEALEKLGNAIALLDVALSPSGMRVDAPELVGAFGVSMVPVPAPSPAGAV
jgi:phage gp29-like protein